MSAGQLPKHLLWTLCYRGYDSLNPAQVHLLCTAVHTQRLVSLLCFTLMQLTHAASRESTEKQIILVVSNNPQQHT